jgi:DNA-directed RNA polymerase subunit M/transcription elongation factor TFIIS
MAVDIVFYDSDLDDEDDEEVLSDDDLGENDIPDESSSSEEEGDDKESVSFESDIEEEEDDDDGDDEVGDDVDIGDDADSGGIDLAEFYDETPKKTAKAVFNKRKRSKPLKVAKAKRTKKRRGLEDSTTMGYLEDDVRKRVVEYLVKFTILKNAEIVERAIYSHTLRNTTILLRRVPCITDIDKDSFKKSYANISYEIISSISQGMKCKTAISNLEINKTGLKCLSFKNEQFNDSQETSNIENPPKVMRGIHTCSVCIRDKDRADDIDRGKRVDWYQQQTRSCDEPMTTFCKCTDCGKKWKF